MKNQKGTLKDEDYKRITNESMDATIKMSIYSSISTILPVIIMLAMGSNAIFTFIFAMFVGLIAGTFSSIFIAPAVWRYARTHFQPKSKGGKKNKAKKEALDEYTFKGINA